MPKRKRVPEFEIPDEILFLILRHLSAVRDIIRLRLVSKAWNLVITNLFSPARQWAMRMPAEMHWVEVLYWTDMSYSHKTGRDMIPCGTEPLSWICKNGVTLHFNQENGHHLFQPRVSFGSQKASEKNIVKKFVIGNREGTFCRIDRDVYVVCQDTIFQISPVRKTMNCACLALFGYDIYPALRYVCLRENPTYHASFRHFSYLMDPTNNVTYVGLMNNIMIHCVKLNESGNVIWFSRCRLTPSASRVGSFDMIGYGDIAVQVDGIVYIHKLVIDAASGKRSFISRAIMTEPAAMFKHYGVRYDAETKSVYSFMIARNEVADDYSVIHGRKLWSFRSSARPADRPYMTLSQYGFTIDLSNRRIFCYFARPLIPEMN